MAVTDDQINAWAAEGRPIYYVPPWPGEHEDNAVFIDSATREETQPTDD